MDSVRALWRSLRSLKGNQRACVVAEPLWAIPYNLFLPFASVYMAAIGLSDAQIGTIASLGLAIQFLWGLLSGALVDKFGRRWTLLVFGLLSWTIPCGLWALAHGYWYFAVAIAFNSMWRVTGNSYSCLIVEDGDKSLLIHIYTMLNIVAVVAGFLAPIAGLCIDRFTLVPTMRALYAAAMVLISAKFVVQFCLSRESAIGRRRMQECRKQPILRLALGGWPAFWAALRQRRMLLCLMLMVLTTCFNTIQANFWPLFIQARYGVRDSMLAVFPLVKAAVTLLVYLLVSARIHFHRVRRPLLMGIGAQGLGLIALLGFLPSAETALWVVFFSAVCDAFALALLGPISESLMSVNIPGEERARINSLIYAGILLVSAPAGWIAGQLSEISRVFPLVINLCLVAAEILVALGISRSIREEQV